MRDTWPIWFVLAVIISLVFIGSKRAPVYTYNAPDKDNSEGDIFEIVNKVNDYRFDMVRLHIKDKQIKYAIDFTTNICNSYKVTFSPGVTLTRLWYEDKGECWEVSKDDLGYVFLKDKKRDVVLADNCYWISKVESKCSSDPVFNTKLIMENIWQTH